MRDRTITNRCHQTNQLNNLLTFIYLQFDAKEGWISLDQDVHIALPGIVFISQHQHQPPQLRLNQIAIRVLHPVNRNKPITIERAKELTKTFVEKFGNEEDISGRHLVLLWISSSTSSTTTRVAKGIAFLLEIETEEKYHDKYNNDDVVVRNRTNDVGNLSLNDNNNNMNDGEYDTDSDDDSDDEDDINDWVFFPSSLNYEDETPTQQINRSQLPQIVSEWMHDVMMTTDTTTADDNNNSNSSSGSSIGSPHVLFEWGDLDLVAHKLNKRRLGMTDDEVTENEYDETIQERKRILKDNHNVSTFDDWFDHVKGGKKVVAEKEGSSSSDNNQQTSESTTTTTTDHAVHLVLESSVPPWEVELYRPGINSNGTSSTTAEDFRLHPAAECIRCLSEDSEESSEDEDDPSNDGIGSYMDFIYRRMMKAAMMTTDDEKKQQTNIIVDETNIDNHSDKKNDQNKNSWLHCIDARDLGCEGACHAEVVREKWNDLLTQEEREGISKPNKEVRNDACPVNENGDAMRFLPENKLNPERIELEDLRSKGLLVRNDDDEDDDDDDDNECQDDVFTGLEFTFPSFELFFGQNTDNLYYSPHVKLAYSPFLANCIQSLDNFEDFFIRLFFGGTVPDALDRLNILETSTRGHVHVRSPILKRWDPESNSYIWEERDDGEEYNTCPYFPSTFHLVARGSFPPRTLSSQLYSNLHDFRGNEGNGQKSSSRRQVALAIKSWIINSIRRNMDDPKASDDMETGGEWFEAYLRAVHRDIYDDIDVSDSTVLLQKNYMKSISGGRPPKHNIGKIKIPSAKDSFEEIVSRFREQDSLPPTTNVITPRVEILAKIMIDIWMSNLFDFSLLLKIANICSNETTKDNVVIVCYSGSSHAKAASKFFCSSSMDFKRKALIGKFSWEDHELKTLDLPSKLWNLSELFR